jgi:hypothetical protein
MTLSLQFCSTQVISLISLRRRMEMNEPRGETRQQNDVLLH